MKTQHTILSGLLALFVLTSAISHSISVHFCGGEIRSVAAFGQAKQCQEQGKGCDHKGSTNHTSINHKGCCEDATFKIDSDKYLSKTTDKVTVENSQFIFLPVADLVHEFHPFSALALNSFPQYRPPLIRRDITVLVQTFLI